MFKILAYRISIKYKIAISNLAAIQISERYTELPFIWPVLCLLKIR